MILFVGSGVSRTLGLPSWDELIAQMATQLRFEPEVFRQYAGNLELAEYFELKKKSLGRLQQWMDRTWHKKPWCVDKSSVHQAIIKLAFPIIYTTNYDRWLEIAFRRQGKAFTRVANVADISRVSACTQIVKLHGDFEHEESLVLTEHSYFDRLMFDTPLDIKLRSDSIGRGILFVGYSLTDLNVRYLLYKLHKLWTADRRVASARPRSYMFTARPNPVQEAILSARGIIPLVSESDDSERGLADFMTLLVTRVKQKAS